VATYSEADILRRRMAEVRHNLHSDVRGVVATAGAATDWRHYVREHPWLAVGAAFAAGFMIVPRRHQPAQVVVHPVAAESAGEHSSSAAKKTRKGIVGALLALAAPVAVRAAQNYASQALEAWLAQQHHAMPPDPTATPSASGSQWPSN
jgi:hypothetical protein